jgi:hypothetical protein
MKYLPAVSPSPPHEECKECEYESYNATTNCDLVAWYQSTDAVPTPSSCGKSQLLTPVLPALNELQQTGLEPQS